MITFQKKIKFCVKNIYYNFVMEKNVVQIQQVSTTNRLRLFQCAVGSGVCCGRRHHCAIHVLDLRAISVECRKFLPFTETHQPLIDFGSGQRFWHTGFFPLRFDLI